MLYCFLFEYCIQNIDKKRKNKYNYINIQKIKGGYSMKKQKTDIAVVGFALFSMFFGAGNLLFPPYLGLISGSHWLISLSGFILADVGFRFIR